MLHDTTWCHIVPQSSTRCHKVPEFAALCHIMSHDVTSCHTKLHVNYRTSVAAVSMSSNCNPFQKADMSLLYCHGYALILQANRTQLWKWKLKVKIQVRRYAEQWSWLLVTFSPLSLGVDRKLMIGMAVFPFPMVHLRLISWRKARVGEEGSCFVSQLCSGSSNNFEHVGKEIEKRKEDGFRALNWHASFILDCDCANQIHNTQIQ